MEVINKYFEHNRPDIFKVYAFGDIHAGSIHCAEHEIQRAVDKVKPDPYAYWVGMGDYADSILANDPRFDIVGLKDWVKKDNILECQRDWLVDLFKPIAPKCLGLLTGNHEEQIHLRYQFDFTRNLCKALNVPYGGYACFLNLHFQRCKGEHGNRHTFTFHLWHGAGAAQTEGSRVMRLMRLVNEIQADIYLMGHLHCITSYTPDRLICQSGKVTSTKLVAAITGSWLTAYTQSKEGQELTPSYAERAGYKPTRIGCPVIYLDPDDNNFWIEC